ncbi:signal peptidase I [Prescottella equi]|uniref:signal peptidase I n=1 Tax=Rhodococcus hoagii TaxID=43767 RepID=UPI001A0E6E4C|nr:signal peptidase I [Prescottella equi]MBM4598030.1 signal peptidase I [Prescottella equi]NKS29521.1 signal peptidase I [Prescottella equi]NKS42596.1 signal peptidase I [Prescottella equi]
MTTSHPESSGTRNAREAALTFGAIAGVICIVATIAGLLFGVKPLIFRSGSMSPEITTGSLALARTVPANELSVGDIVSVENADGTRITHRVYAIQEQTDRSSSVTLKGDANTDPDVEPYVISEADRVFWSAGRLGYVAAWLSSSTAIFFGGVLVGALLVIVARPSGRRGSQDHTDSTDLENETPHGGRTQTP